MAFVYALMMQSEIYDSLNELFLSTEIYGIIGPSILAIVGIYLANKDRFLGFFWILLLALFTSFYLSLVGDEPSYWWHGLISMLGIIICATQTAKAR